MPPEALGKEKFTNDKHEIWSLGIIAHEIFAGSHPFQFDGFELPNILNGTYKINYLKIKEKSVIDQIIKGILILINIFNTLKIF